MTEEPKQPYWWLTPEQREEMWISVRLKYEQMLRRVEEKAARDDIIRRGDLILGAKRSSSGS